MVSKEKRDDNSDVMMADTRGWWMIYAEREMWNVGRERWEEEEGRSLESWQERMLDIMDCLDDS
jgi:hypothetical protein